MVFVEHRGSGHQARPALLHSAPLRCNYEDTFQRHRSNLAGSSIFHLARWIRIHLVSCLVSCRIIFHLILSHSIHSVYFIRTSTFVSCNHIADINSLHTAIHTSYLMSTTYLHSSSSSHISTVDTTAIHSTANSPTPSTSHSVSAHYNIPTHSNKQCLTVLQTLPMRVCV